MQNMQTFIQFRNNRTKFRANRKSIQTKKEQFKNTLKVFDDFKISNKSV